MSFCHFDTNFIPAPGHGVLKAAGGRGTWWMGQGTASGHSQDVEHGDASARWEDPSCQPVEIHWALIQLPGLASVSLHSGWQRKPGKSAWLVSQLEPLQGADGTGDSRSTCHSTSPRACICACVCTRMPIGGVYAGKLTYKASTHLQCRLTEYS